MNNFVDILLTWELKQGILIEKDVIFQIWFIFLSVKGFVSGKNIGKSKWFFAGFSPAARARLL